MCQNKLTSELASATTKLEVLTRFNNSLSSDHNTSTLRTAKHLKEDLENSKISLDDPHTELIMATDPSSGDAFQAKALVSDYHSKVNKAVAAIWGHAAAELVDLPPSLPKIKSSSTGSPAPARVS